MRTENMVSFIGSIIFVYMFNQHLPRCLCAPIDNNDFLFSPLTIKVSPSNSNLIPTSFSITYRSKINFVSHCKFLLLVWLDCNYDDLNSTTNHYRTYTRTNQIVRDSYGLTGYNICCNAKITYLTKRTAPTPKTKRNRTLDYQGASG